MIGLSAVTRIGFFSTVSAIISSLTVKPAIALSASTLLTFASSMIDSSKLWAITGSITFSSKLPIWALIVIVASLPITCAQTIIVASAMTGLILPGIIDEP